MQKYINKTDIIAVFSLISSMERNLYLGRKMSQAARNIKQYELK